MSRTKKLVAEDTDPPEWFDPWISSKLYIPEHPSYTSKIFNKHVLIDSFVHPKHSSTLEIDWIEQSKPSTDEKKVKNYQNSINKTQDLLRSSTDPKEMKTLQTKLKCLLAKNKKQEVNKNKITKNLTIGLPLSKEQHRIVSRWYDECLMVYNTCLDFKVNKKVPNEILYDMKSLRASVFDHLFVTPNIKKQACYETLGDEVRSFLSNLKSCNTCMERKVIKHYTQKPRSLKNNRSLMVRGTAIGPKGLFPDKLGVIRGWTKIYKDILLVCGESTRFCDSRLVYDSVTKRYTLNIPYYSDQVEILNRKQVVTLDPGEKIFQTYYSPEESGRIGHDIRLTILQEEKKIRRLERIIHRKKNKKGEKLQNPKAIKRRIQLKYNKIRNIVSELHHQTSKFLTDNYSRIYIPPFETQQMVRNERKRTDTLFDKKEYKRKGRLNKRVKFVLNSLSHYRFRQHLLNKCKEKGCKIELINESYTSLCCGNCGLKSKTYNNRVKSCSCGCKIDRDLNGSRNIFIKMLTS